MHHYLNTEKWVQRGRTTLDAACETMRVINKQLWLMGDASGVVVRDATKLSRICSIASGDMGAVLDAAAMKSGDVVLATRTGLYHLESPATGTQTVTHLFHCDPRYCTRTCPQHAFMVHTCVSTVVFSRVCGEHAFRHFFPSMIAVLCKIAFDASGIFNRSLFVVCWYFCSDEEQRTQIAGGYFMSVNIYHGTVFASCVSTSDVIEGRAYVYEKVWTLATTFELPFKASATSKPLVTVSAKNSQLKFVSTNDTKVIVFGLSGEKLSAVWSVFGISPTLTNPRICDDDYGGFLLVMTGDVSRFVLVDEFGLLKVHKLHSKVGKVHTAVFYSDHAYVVNDDRKTLRRFHTH